MDKEKRDWLRARQQSIQAGNVAPILGEHPSKGGIDVWLEMTGEIEEEDAERLHFGHDMEEPIAKAYSRVTGRLYENPGDYYIHKHQDIPWLGATLDRVTWKTEIVSTKNYNIGFKDNYSGKGALECKAEGGYNKRDGRIVKPDEWKEEPHIWQTIQNQIQMACAGFSWGSLAAWFPGHVFRYHDHDYDPEFLTAIYPILEEFWGYVQRREPPPLRFQETKKLEAMKRLWNCDNGETVPLTHEQMVLVDRWEELKKEAKRCDNERKDIEAQIYEMIGSAAFGALPDGTMLVAKTVQNKGYTREVKPFEYRTLRRKKI